MQECYCRLAQLSDVTQIASPRAYFFTMARNLAHRQRRRARVVRIEPITDAYGAELESDFPLQDRIAVGKQELDRVRSALSSLSERAQRIFVMRRVEGLSQREIAAALGVTEAIVENEASRSLRAILSKLTKPAAEPAASSNEGIARAGSR